MSLCRACGNKAPQNELLSYGGRCELCWSSKQPPGDRLAARDQGVVYTTVKELIQRRISINESIRPRRRRR